MKIERDLYTLTQIARMLDIPDSTLRNYRDQFKQYLAPIAAGRRQLYNDDAVTKLRLIANRKKSGKIDEEIHRELDQQFPKVIEVATSTADLPHEEKQELAIYDKSQEIINQFTLAVQDLGICKDGISEIKEALRQIASETKQQKEEIAQLRAELEKKNRPWWKRMFRRL